MKISQTGYTIWHNLIQYLLLSYFLTIKMCRRLVANCPRLDNAVFISLLKAYVETIRAYISHFLLIQGRNVFRPWIPGTSSGLPERLLAVRTSLLFCPTPCTTAEPLYCFNIAYFIIAIALA